MKLAMSQIAWEAPQQEQALAILQQYGFAGLEIAPPRVAGPVPYDFPQKAGDFSAAVKAEYGLCLCSMQSIWFGQQGSMFGPQRAALIGYTRQAVDFAKAGGIPNLVFGNPKNRVMPQGAKEKEAIAFFEEISAYAAGDAVIALEANPAVYGTNFMNTTPEAMRICRLVDSPGCRVNLDVGTMLINSEPVHTLRGQVPLIHHVHISEPQLAMIERREEHRQLAALLREEGYAGYVSIEMKGQTLENIEKAAAWLAEVFA